jgi:hypothetical protein
MLSNYTNNVFVGLDTHHRRDVRAKMVVVILNMYSIRNPILDSCITIRCLQCIEIETPNPQ